MVVAVWCTLLKDATNIRMLQKAMVLSSKTGDMVLWAACVSTTVVAKVEKEQGDQHQMNGRYGK